MNAYAGIGSRETPNHILTMMRRIAAAMQDHGWLLRTGGADGADSAFETGAYEACDSPEIELYLPWHGYNKRAFPHMYTPTKDGYDLAAQFHPAWSRCSQGARALHARNSHIILGPDCDDPVKLVICWTPGGSASGGTGQGIRLARHYGIPVHDLGVHKVMAEYLERLANNEATT